MITIIAKKSCRFCTVLTEWLTEANIPFTIYYAPENASGLFPRLYLHNKLIFTGLPHAQDLQAFLRDVNHTQNSQS